MIYVGKDYNIILFQSGEVLADIVPTLLNLMEVNILLEMEGKCLLFKSLINLFLSIVTINLQLLHISNHVSLYLQVLIKTYQNEFFTFNF